MLSAALHPSEGLTFLIDGLVAIDPQDVRLAGRQASGLQEVIAPGWEFSVCQFLVEV